MKELPSHPMCVPFLRPIPLQSPPPYFFRPPDRNSGVRCNSESDFIRVLVVVAYFVTVTFGAGFLTFFYGSLWIPNVSQIFINSTYGIMRLGLNDSSLPTPTTPDPTLETSWSNSSSSWNGTDLDPSMT